jgi:DNA replication ATP-dependent helicase Dna2
MQTLVATRRTAFISCPEPTEKERFKTNTHEAHLCARLVSTIIQLYQANHLAYDPTRTIGIIAPFRGQGALIRHELEALGIPHTEDISIDTVERYQGSQRDIIIYCTTITSATQLELIVDPIDTIDRKLNVAVTRARQQLFVIGIPNVLSADANYRSLMQEL